MYSCVIVTFYKKVAPYNFNAQKNSGVVRVCIKNEGTHKTKDLYIFLWLSIESSSVDKVVTTTFKLSFELSRKSI